MLSFISNLSSILIKKLAKFKTLSQVEKKDIICIKLPGMLPESGVMNWASSKNTRASRIEMGTSFLVASSTGLLRSTWRTLFLSLTTVMYSFLLSVILQNCWVASLDQPPWKSKHVLVVKLLSCTAFTLSWEENIRYALNKPPFTIVYQHVKTWCSCTRCTCSINPNTLQF